MNIRFHGSRLTRSYVCNGNKAAWLLNKILQPKVFSDEFYDRTPTRRFRLFAEKGPESERFSSVGRGTQLQLQATTLWRVLLHQTTPISLPLPLLKTNLFL